MKQRFFLILLTILCITCLFSCEETPEMPPEPPSEPSTPALDFESRGDGTCVLVGLGTYADSVVIIPERSPDGDTVTSIASGTLLDREGQPITELHIPKTVTSMAADALVGCRYLTRITVAQGNEAFTSQSGHLYTKDLSTLIKYASASSEASYTAPQELRIIATGAFTNCVSLSSLSLSSGLRYISSKAFSECANLTDVYYDGTFGKWSGVFVFAGNDTLLNAEIHTQTVSSNTEGSVILCLDRSQAPLTVENFLTLVNDGFYDGLTMHRIIEGFMIQGGDPNGNGTGGAENKIPGEFLSNGVDNTLRHKRGVISMARAADANSASSQFFICHRDASWLDGEYAAFGWIAEGMAVVDAIATVDYSFTDNNGSVPRAEQPEIVSARILTNYDKAEAGYDYVELVFSYYTPQEAE